MSGTVRVGAVDALVVVVQAVAVAVGRLVLVIARVDSVVVDRRQHGRGCGQRAQRLVAASRQWVAVRVPACPPAAANSSAASLAALPLLRLRLLRRLLSM